MYLTFFILTSIISKKKLIHIIFKVICNSSGEVYKNAFWMERETYANVNGIRVKLSTFLLLYILSLAIHPYHKNLFYYIKTKCFFHVCNIWQDEWIMRKTIIDIHPIWFALFCAQGNCWAVGTMYPFLHMSSI